MNKEIGGYIEFEHTHGEMLHGDAILLNCGRRAFSYLVKSRGIQKVWVPKFSCGSVIEPFEKGNCEIKLYSVGMDFIPKLDDVPSDDWIVLINYYGQIDNQKILEIAEKHPHLIVDNIQAYFQEPVEELDTVYTCRKFFGVTDGAILYSNSVLEDSFETDESFGRMTYLMGRFERTASEFYGLYDKNNAIFNDEPIKRMSRLTENILHGIDYGYVSRCRKENFAYLHEKFKNINKLDLAIPDGPFMYPLYIEGGREIRKILQAKKIYIPTLWPDVFTVAKEGDVEHQMAADIIPLPVDQRYRIGDMDYMISEVQRCID